MKGKKAVVWGYFVKNLGDDLMLKAFLEETKQKYKKIYLHCDKEYKKYYSNLGVTVVSTNSIIQRAYRVISKIFSLNPPTLYYKLTSQRNTDFIMLGGSLFAESFDYKKIDNLMYAVNHANNSYIIGSNFGPYKTKNFLMQYRRIFEKCRDICFRDRHSYEMFSDISIVRYAPDVILSGVWADNEKNQSNNSIVISVINLLNRSEFANEVEQYEQMLASIAKYHFYNGDDVVLVAFCECEGDAEACDRVKKLCGNIETKVLCYSDFSFLNVFSKAKKVYGTRFHSVILSMYYGIPCVPIVYNEKTYNALNTYCSSFDFVDIKKLTNHTWKDIANLSGDLVFSNEIKREAKRQFDGVIKN